MDLRAINNIVLSQSNTMLQLKANINSKIGIILNLYSHVISEMQDELADAVTDVLSG